MKDSNRYRFLRFFIPTIIANEGMTAASTNIMQHKSFTTHKFAAWTAAAICALLLQSCGGPLSIPYSSSRASEATFNDLNLSEGQYNILKTVSESATVIYEYRKDGINITSGDGDFSYLFRMNKKLGFYQLVRSSGNLSLGRLTNDPQTAALPIGQPEELARQVAMSRIINTAIDFGADGIIEPITTMSVSEIGTPGKMFGSYAVEYKVTVRAKLISLKTK